MRLTPDRIVVTTPDGSTLGASPWSASGTYRLGPCEVGVAFDDNGSGQRLSWWVANAGDQPVTPWIVAVVFRVDHTGPLRMFRHGYQSWTACDTAVLGVDDDPSRSNTTGLELVSGVHHADQRTAAAGDLRSEFVTVLADASVPATPDAPGALVAGFDAGVEHDGTFRLRATPDGGAELWIEALLGGARLDPGRRFDLHDVGVTAGAPLSSLLGDWARRVGRLGAARVSSPFQVGWCSWYHYFHDVTEDHLRTNLAASGPWPFDVFQLDDGYQAAIGDWLDTNAKFPTDIGGLADAIRSEGRTPGIWIAPFIAAPDSSVATTHPDWLATTPGGGPLPGMFNPPWGGGMGGVMLALDTTNPEVLAHLTHVASTLRDAGYDYLKLDFTFAPSFDGVFTDPTRTPAQRVRAGFEAVRRGAGDDAFILGCGAPLSQVVGIVDGMRIGSDVDPRWTLDPERVGEAYPDALPATLHAFRNTLSRSFMHRALWLNDPDCVMLRTTETRLAPEAVASWAHTVGVSGGMVLVSDDLALLGDDARGLLDEVITIGRAADAEAIAGAPPVSPDLLAGASPTTLESRTHRVVVDLDDGRGTLERLG